MIEFAEVAVARIDAAMDRYAERMRFAARFDAVWERLRYASQKGLFHEEDHPRADDGKFGDKGQGQGKKRPATSKPTSKPKPKPAPKTVTYRTSPLYRDRVAPGKPIPAIAHRDTQEGTYHVSTLSGSLAYGSGPSLAAALADLYRIHPYLAHREFEPLDDERAAYWHQQYLPSRGVHPPATERVPHHEIRPARGLATGLHATETVGSGATNEKHAKRLAERWAKKAGIWGPATAEYDKPPEGARVLYCGRLNGLVERLDSQFDAAVDRLRYRNALAERLSLAMDRCLVHRYGERWVTLGGKPNADKGTKHSGGFPALIDEKGNIKASAAGGLQGKHVSEVKGHFDEAKKSPKIADKPVDNLSKNARLNSSEAEKPKPEPRLEGKMEHFNNALKVLQDKENKRETDIQAIDALTAMSEEDKVAIDEYIAQNPEVHSAAVRSRAWRAIKAGGSVSAKLLTATLTIPPAMRVTKANKLAIAIPPEDAKRYAAGKSYNFDNGDGLWTVTGKGEPYNDSSVSGSRAMRWRQYLYVTPNGPLAIQVAKMASGSAATLPKIPASGRSFTRTTDFGSSVYSVGQYIRDKDGKVWVVTAVDSPRRFNEGLSRGKLRDEGYEHTAYARPATEQEIVANKKATKLTELKRQLHILSMPPDDERDRPRIEADRKRVMAELKAMEDGAS